MRDVFNLYRYDDVLYTMRLTGQEIKDMLEMSYGLWTAQMKTPDDHVMLFGLCIGRRPAFGVQASGLQLRFGCRHLLHGGRDETPTARKSA